MRSSELKEVDQEVEELKKNQKVEELEKEKNIE